MLRLALCDDEDAQRSSIRTLLQEYAAARPALTLSVSAFSSSQKLLEEDAQKGPFDIYLLDIVMPELSGIELGVKLRSHGSKGAIIYLTISPEYAIDSYMARAFYYLMKPVDPERLYQVLDQAIETLEKQKAACVMVKTRDGLQLARLDELLYVELTNRTLCYHFTNETQLNSITLRNPFSKELAPLLADARFVQCTAGIAVNLFYVTSVERNTLQLDGGGQLPLSRGMASRVRKRWRDYWLNQLERETT